MAIRALWSLLGTALTVAAVGFAGGASGQGNGLPQATLLIESIGSAGNGGYRIKGEVLDTQSNPACALVLASGRCMFTCGPGSLTCEGGTSPLDLGQFELDGLPTEPDGSVVVQAFVEGHVSHSEKLFPQQSQLASWSVSNNVCCSAGSGAISVTIGGVTRRSELTGCGENDMPTWEGYTQLKAGVYPVTATYTSACGNASYPVNVDFAPGECYLLFNDRAQQSFFTVLKTSCQDPNQ